MKTNIKMKCNDSQFRQAMKILKIDYQTQYYYEDMYVIVNNDLNVDFGYGGTIYNESGCKEIDADLFIRTNGTCGENELKNFIQSQNENIDISNDWLKEFNNISLKLKKKNEILKKARIKRKNQREELHKLNIKLQKCISLEEHNKIIEKINKGNVNYLSNSIISRDKEIEKLKAVIEYLESKVK